MSIWYEADDWITFKKKALPVPKSKMIQVQQGPIQPTRLAMTSVKIPHDHIKKLNKLVRAGIFVTRSEAIRYCIHYYLQNTD